jgi:hypothetical protein
MRVRRFLWKAPLEVLMYLAGLLFVLAMAALAAFLLYLIFGSG